MLNPIAKNDLKVFVKLRGRKPGTGPAAKKLLIKITAVFLGLARSYGKTAFVRYKACRPVTLIVSSMSLGIISLKGTITDQPAFKKIIAISIDFISSAILT